MAIKPTKKNSSPMVTGKAKPKAAESTDKKGTGVAAERKATGHGVKDPNTMRADEITPGGDNAAMTVSIGNKTREPKTSGIETRGNGAATKGRIARGPMA
jgi:hypothetical protein